MHGGEQGFEKGMAGHGFTWACVMGEENSPFRDMRWPTWKNRRGEVLGRETRLVGLDCDGAARSGL